jgi:endonuclease/exonuclease/phosphatase family metal-dependent hydrolase
MVAGCDAVSYPLGNSVSYKPGETTKIIDVTGPIDCLDQKYEFNIKNYYARRTGDHIWVYFNHAGQFGAPSINSPMSDESFAVAWGFSSYALTDVVWFTGRDKFYDNGAYITIGDDRFGELGPKATATTTSTSTITVTTFNTFLGRDNKPEACTRGSYLLNNVLSQLDTDVLLLQEVNYRDDNCATDGHDLVSYLWSLGKTHITNDSYAGSSSGSGTSLKKDGKFPYVSQMISGIAEGGDEKKTGGGVILSKWPLTMIANKKFNNCTSSCGGEEKGFIVVKIIKNEKTYFIINTHTQAGKETNETTRKAQLDEIAKWISDNRSTLAGHRVILGGDLNTALDEDAKSSEGINTYFTTYDPTNFGSWSGDTLMSDTRRINTAYYPYSRDNRKNFYANSTDETSPGEVFIIDWLIPILSKSGTSFSTPSTYQWWVHPVRWMPFTYADLSDHFAVSAVFRY